MILRADQRFFIGTCGIAPPRIHEIVFIWDRGAWRPIRRGRDVRFASKLPGMSTKTAWLPLLGLAFLGCGGSPSGPPAPRNISEAIGIFERFWHRELLPGLEEPKKRFVLALGEKVPGQLQAGASTFDQFRRELDYSLMPAERRELILYGSPEGLPAAGACWRVESGGGFGAEIRACLDPTTGKVIVVWIAPEG
jgi:hypothetical protein